MLFGDQGSPASGLGRRSCWGERWPMTPWVYHKSWQVMTCDDIGYTIVDICCDIWYDSVWYMIMIYDYDIWLWYMIMIYDYDIWLWYMIMIYDYDIWLWYMIMIYGMLYPYQLATWWHTGVFRFVFGPKMTQWLEPFPLSGEALPSEAVRTGISS